MSPGLPLVKENIVKMTDPDIVNPDSSAERAQGRIPDRILGLEANVTSAKSTAFGVSACVLLAVSIVLGRQQDRDLSGIHGIPVEGHDIVGGVEIVGPPLGQAESAGV